MSEQLTRRSFLKGVAGVVGVAAVNSIAGCAAKETPATSAAAESTTAAETTTAAAASPAGTYIPGTYTGTADGIHSTITVTMTFDEEKVTDVVLDVSGETPGYGQDAGDALREALLAAQSTQIDAVSGSTITSQAVIVAADKCFAQARGEAWDRAQYRRGFRLRDLGYGYPHRRSRKRRHVRRCLRSPEGLKIPDYRTESRGSGHPPLVRRYRQLRVQKSRGNRQPQEASC